MRGLPSGCEIEEDESKATCAAQVGALGDKQWSAGFQFQAEADKATKHTCTRRMLMPACSRQAPECLRALLAILIKTGASWIAHAQRPDKVSTSTRNACAS